jgi:uncharacterized protein (DUF2235 family)
MKKIVVCCDGTGNEFGVRTSNVIKLYKMLKCDPAQIGYYHPGVGTMGARAALTKIGKWWTKVIGLAFGYGISDNVADAYQFLMQTFEPGDEVYCFGFSRGAYTVRSLCGMLHAVGLLSRGNEAQIPYAIRMLKSKPIDFAVAASFKKTFSIECKPHFVGLWDTVSSVGWVYNAVRFPFTTAASNADFRLVRHAISIDERRAFFRQNSFLKPRDPQQDVKEVWFAGVHSDVGGSYNEDESQPSKIALRWMVCEAEHAGLTVDPTRKAEILGGKLPYVAPDPLTRNQHESLSRWWWIAEFWPKITHIETSPGTWKKHFRLNLGRRRYIPPDVVVHESVDVRLKDPNLKYKPSNLPTQHASVGDQCGIAPTMSAEGTASLTD